MANEYIEVSRSVRLYYQKSELLSAVEIDLTPGQINIVPSDVWAACFAHNHGRQGQLIEQYLASGAINWLSDDGRIAQAKVDGALPFASPKVEPLQAAAQTFAQVLDAKGASAQAEAQDTAIRAAEKALELATA